MQLPPLLRPRRGAAVLIALAVAAACLPASATLGGDEASVERDRAALAATATDAAASAGTGYTVRAFTLPSGTVVREYLAGSGTVFGVAWEGPMLPDLKQLLGPGRFASFNDGARSRNREGRRGPMQLRPADGSGLVVESTGRPRAFAGRAYLAEQLPAGVTTDAIR